MLIEYIFDLRWIDFDAANIDHIFHAINDIVVAIGVHAPDVAGVKPTVAQDQSRLGWAVPITKHEAWGIDDDLTQFTGCDWFTDLVNHINAHAGQWLPDRTWFGQGLMVKAAQTDLRQAITFVDHRPELCLPLTCDFQWERRTSRNIAAHRLQLISPGLGL